MKTADNPDDGTSLDALFEQLPDAALWIDARGVILDANRLAARLLEQPAADLVGRALTSCWTDEDALPLLRSLTDADPTELPELFRGRLANGRACTLEPTFVRGLRSDRVLLILEDAGERTQHAARARMITAATEQASEGIAVIDVRAGTQRLVWANPAFYGLLGFADPAHTPADLVSAQVREALAGLQLRAGIAPEDGVTAGRGSLRRVDGARISVRYALGPIRDGSADPDARWWVCTFTDTTEQDRVDDMLQEQQAVNRDARDMAALADIVAGIAHDFNNSITVIRNLAALSSREEDLIRVREDLDSIMQASDDAAELARSLTAFGRRGTQQDREETFDFDETVAQIVQVVGRGLRLKLDIETDLASEARIRSRPGMLQQVLYNLMINARDAVEDHGTLSIRTRPVGEGPAERVELVVTDDGVGMTPEVRKRAFVPYFTTKGASGTGLGLAKVHHLLHQNQGTITVQSTPGAGTTFTIRLPVARTEDLREGPSGTALLLDDDPAIRRLVPKLLRRREVSCPTAESSLALEALELVRAPDLVIVDLVLGHEDGREVARTLRERWPTSRFVLTTGAELPDASAPPAPFDYVLAKPFGSADVDAMLAYFAPAEP